MRIAPALTIAACLVIAGLFATSWFAPLMVVQIKYAFWMAGTQISLISTLQGLWASDPILALVLSFLTLMAPMVKLLGTGLIAAGLLDPKTKGLLWVLGKLAMADVLLIVLYIAIFKGLDGGTITTQWGLWLYTGAVLASLALSLATAGLPHSGGLPRTALPRHESA